jgi:D-glycero-alpha-D-manno-heptose-7-phosphate kinase
MIIAKTPLRIPFGGGLTDLKKYAGEYGGATVSVTIDKYVYVTLKPNVDGYINLKYMDVHEKISRIEDVRHDLIRETLKLMKLDQIPVDIYIMSDLNSESGLGSSGAVTVSLLNAMHRFKGEEVSRQQLLEEASYIEVEVLDSASGYHDPSICALGGLKLIEYTKEGIEGRDIIIPDIQKQVFEDRLLFFYSGKHFKSKPSLDLLNTQMDSAVDTMHAIKQVAYDLEHAFLSGNMQRVGELIQEQQRLKQTLPGKFNDEYVEQLIERINKLGAYAQLPGGKIGAFVIVYCREDNQNKVRSQLSDLQEVKLRFSFEGTQAVSL